MKTEYQETLDKKFGIKQRTEHKLFPTTEDIKLHEIIPQEFTKERIIAYLSCNPENRDVRKARVEGWELKIVDGEFHDASCFIEVTEHPETHKLILSGGQHKLYAMLDLGYFGHTFNVRRVAWEERIDSNSGDRNTTADNLAMEFGRRYSTYDANCVYTYIRNERKKVPRFPNATRTIVGLLDEGGLGEFVEELKTRSTSSRTGKILSTGVYGAIIGDYIANPQHMALLLDFAEKVRNPDLAATRNGKLADPAYALEDALDKFMRARRRGGKERSDRVYAATKYTLEKYLVSGDKVTAAEIAANAKFKTF